MGKIDAFLPQKIVGNMAIYVVAQSETLNPKNEDATADLSSIPDGEWKNLAACKQATFKPDTEDDAEDHFDAVTKTRVKASNTQITGRSWTFQLERYAPVFEAMYQGVKNPLSDATLEAMGSGQPVEIYATNTPYLPVGMKLCMYDGNGSLLKTQYMYGDLRCDGDQTFEGKILRPQAVFEVAASAHNKAVFESALVGTGAAS